MRGARALPTPPLPSVEMWTDGSYQTRPPLGGWAVIMAYTHTVRTEGGHQFAQTRYRLLGGWYRNTSNTAMEAVAVAEGLRKLRRRSAVTVYTDSAYVQTGVDKLHAGDFPATLADVWTDIEMLCAQHQVEVVKVRAHGRNRMNNLVDDLAKYCREEQAGFDQLTFDPFTFLYRLREPIYA